MIERTIGRAAEQAGVGVETIRFYERRGLIKQPARPRNGGYRSYDDSVIERVRFIRQAQELGFSLHEIAELLSLQANPDTDCRDIRARALRKREDVNEKIAQLQRIREALDELIASCPGGGALRSCTIMDALTQPSLEASKLRPFRSRSQNRRGAMKGRKVKTATFKIEGMHCDGCAETIKALATTMPGVHAADVSFNDGRARILCEPKSINEDELVKAVESSGRFRVTAR
ncbi:MAG: MerR family transcriptional regulator [Mesorhizobium sp.]|nr:MAG: MerR family transcriptional regulator [Mesorhizobium sp.]